MAAILFYLGAVLLMQDGKKRYREEQFGPVVPPEDIKTALEYVITSAHGQQVSIFSKNPDRIGTLVDTLLVDQANRSVRIRTKV